MATAGGRRQRGGQLLVLGVEPAPGALGQVQVAEHLVPDRGSARPRKLSIGGWPGGKPDERGSSAIRRSRIGCGSSISAPSSPLPCGRCPIRCTVSGGMPTCTNSARPPSGADHPQRRVARADQLARRLGDPPQQHRQRQIPDHHLVGPQQPPQPALGAPSPPGPAPPAAPATGPAPAAAGPGRSTRQARRVTCPQSQLPCVSPRRHVAPAASEIESGRFGERTGAPGVATPVHQEFWSSVPGQTGHASALRTGTSASTARPARRRP